MEKVYLGIVLLPLFGSVVAGLFGRWLTRTAVHRVAISSVGLSFALSLVAVKHIVVDGQGPDDVHVYTWLISGGMRFEIGFLVDRLSVLMASVVTFVSLMVHVYTIGYMHDDPGYKRFFSYIALFTFAMLMLVLANNFLQLFFGWEGVGLVSYLLIGFWYERESAIYANLKAFIVNRVGDFGFLLGIAAIATYFGTLHYVDVFDAAPDLVGRTIDVVGGLGWSVITLICILLFVGAMGKSAQMPLHVWLPDSMEGPTPISALIHAATMVTAGIFMVARMSPLYELSATALTVVMVIGSITAFAMGLVGLVQNDIKRVVAYSTLSQLGYMTAALGASAYGAAIFHLMTHAFFKALLFLAAGSVIIAMHHVQDMRRMGGLRRYLPVTYWTALVGSLALIGFPGFSGFFSKDAIIEAIHLSRLPGAGLAYWLLLLGVFVTALYTFRMFFLVFHGRERFDEQVRQHLRESPGVVTVPLVLLAVPSLLIGYLTIEPLLFGGYFGSAIEVLPERDVLGQLGAHFAGPGRFVAHGLAGPAVWLAAAGAALAWYMYLHRPELADTAKGRLAWLYRVLERKYGFDEFNDRVFAGGARRAGNLLWRGGDVAAIDGVMVNGTARLIGWFSTVLRHIQSGYLFHYAFAMILGLLGLLTLFALR